MTASRREFLGSSAAVVAALNAAARKPMSLQDGPSNSNFSPVPLKGNTTFEELGKAGLSDAMTKAISQAPRGDAISWGIPFRIDRPILLKDGPVTERVQNLKAEWLVFCHTADVKPLEKDSRGFIRPMRGEGYLGEHIADYTIVYADGTEVRSEIRRRHHVGTFRRIWGENCFQAVAHRKPHAVRTVREQPSILAGRRRRGLGNRGDARGDGGQRKLGQLAVGLEEPAPRRKRSPRYGSRPRPAQRFSPPSRVEARRRNRFDGRRGARRF